MKLRDKTYNMFIEILKEELVPAMGCTEPIAIAYCSAKAREALGTMPEKVSIAVSGNIIKNVKSVVVPNTGGLRGIESAVAAGIVAGDAKTELQVLAKVTEEDIAKMHQYLETTPIVTSYMEDGHILDIEVTVEAGLDVCKVRLQDSHTNIVSIEKNGELLYENGLTECQNMESAGMHTDRSVLNVEAIVEFADMLEVEDVKELFDRQIEYNMAIAQEGITHHYGANVGKVLLQYGGDHVLQRAKAMAAAGSDARMNGCHLPVVINSGSGNQGITASVPVIVYWQSMDLEKEALYRALAVSNLCTIRLKSGIGKLSAYCGAISAGCGAGAGIAYLEKGGYREVAHTLVNALAMLSGTVCDGAKSSCAAKIASAVEAGVLGHYMFSEGNQFLDGEGLVKKGVEKTIDNIGRLARDGMGDTDRKIIQMMVGTDAF